MGLLLLEKKELISKGEKLQTSAEAIELQYRHDQAAHASALAEAKKREESLKKAIGVEKQCLTSVGFYTMTSDDSIVNCQSFLTRCILYSFNCYH